MQYNDIPWGFNAEYIADSVPLNQQHCQSRNYGDWGGPGSVLCYPISVVAAKGRTHHLWDRTQMSKEQVVQDPHI